MQGLNAMDTNTPPTEREDAFDVNQTPELDPGCGVRYANPEEIARLAATIGSLHLDDDETAD